VDVLEAHRAEEPAAVALVLCLAYTGARVGELCNANVAHIVRGPAGVKLILAEHKTDRTGEEREIELPEQALVEMAALPRYPGGSVFGGLNVDRMEKLWSKWRAAANIDGLRMHDLRRTWASHGKSAGASLHAVGDMMGHKATQTTAGYAYLFEDARAAGAQAIADSVDKARRKPRNGDEPEGVPV
jgi:integrase